MKRHPRVSNLPAIRYAEAAQLAPDAASYSTLGRLKDDPKTHLKKDYLDVPGLLGSRRNKKRNLGGWSPFVKMDGFQGKDPGFPFVGQKAYF